MNVTNHPSARIQPPHDLSIEQVAVWKRTVASRPAAYFDLSITPILRAYCVLAIEHERLSAAIVTLDPLEDSYEYAATMRMLDLVTGRISALARSMRLTMQSQHDARSASRAQRGPMNDEARRELTLLNYAG